MKSPMITKKLRYQQISLKRGVACVGTSDIPVTIVGGLRKIKVKDQNRGTQKK